MIADDPMGRRGPNIDEFLSIKSVKNFQSNPNLNNLNQNNQNNNTNNNNKNASSSSSSHMKGVASAPAIQPLTRFNLNTINNNNNNQQLPLQSNMFPIDEYQFNMNQNFSNFNNNGPKINPQNNATKIPPVRMVRSPMSTGILFKNLSEMYPNSIEKIQYLLEQNIFESDLEVFKQELNANQQRNGNNNNQRSNKR